MCCEQEGITQKTITMLGLILENKIVLRLRFFHFLLYSPNQHPKYIYLSRDQCNY